MTVKPPKLRFSAIPALLFAVGLGLVFYFGHLWYRLPVYSAAEIEQSVEINLALDMQRIGGAVTTTDLDLRRQTIRDQLLAEIDQERREVQRYVATGLVLLLMSIINLMLLRRWASR